MIDFFGQELQVGDTVIYGTTSSQPRGFNAGIIIRFTTKKVEVENPLKKTGRWIKGHSHEHGGYWEKNLPEISQCYPEQLCKIDPGLLTIKLLQQ